MNRVFSQFDFSGGSNLLIDPTNLGGKEYFLLINGRNRYETITSIKEPLISEDLPAGRYQGCYGAGNIVIVFISGLAYYKDFSNPSSTYLKVDGFSMNAAEDFLYACLVPASTVNFTRIPTSSNINGPVNLTLALTASPQCLVVQDGINQPMLIFSTGGSRPAATYDQWTKDDNREYVPIGKQMLYHNGILYIVCKDVNGRYTLLGRSVTGRPLDFMVNITQSGDKLPLEKDGGANSVAYRVDYNEITALQSVNDANGGFYVSTLRTSYIVTPNFDITFFGEPTFRSTFLFSAGAINNFSVTDVLGDTALIDFAGITSFNSVAQFRVEGKNSPFSAKLATLFNGITQSVNAATNFDNYCFFSMDTVFGPAIIVYDTLRQSFVGIDQFSNLGVDETGFPARIKMFCEIKTNLGRRFFFITTSNKFCEYFGSSTTATCSLFTKEFCSGDPKISTKPVALQPIFSDAQENGLISAAVYVDRILSDTGDVDISRSLVIPTPPIAPPFGNYSRENIENDKINFFESSQGYQTMVKISWNFTGTLTGFNLMSVDMPSDSSLAQQARNYAASN